MIQCKRERKIGPSAIEKILSDVPSVTTPYGYILAASTTFSKRSHDTFRDTLRAKGVMEFYLWGKEALEDMLYQPKNDRLLFAYFGISLIMTRRKLTTEMRASVSAKNKLIKSLLLPLQGEFFQELLLRDINAEQYPEESEYPDFDTNPRWVQRRAVAHHPHGLEFHFRKFHAFFDRDKKEWDYSELVDLINRPEETDDWATFSETSEKVSNCMFGKPRAFQGAFNLYGIIPYRDILLIDTEGDAKFPIPHLYLEMDKYASPYSITLAGAEIGQFRFHPDDSWTRIKFFPKKIPTQSIRQRKPITKPLELPASLTSAISKHEKGADTLYFPTDEQNHFQLGSVHKVSTSGTSSEDLFVRVTALLECTFQKYAEHLNDTWSATQAVTRQLGREPAAEEILNIVEIERAYAWQWDQSRKR